MPGPEVKRRLAAILAADVAGYSRLMEIDETGTLERLKALHRELVQAEIHRANGRVVKLMGDGLLAEFPSVIEAVQCALSIQEAMPEREADQPESRRIQLRIGINLGDIIVEHGDIFGDGVNIAARLESLAQPGSVCISEAVRSAVGKRLPLDCTYLGEQNLKNISDPVGVYEAKRAQGDVPAHRVATTNKRPAIAVLPFENMSGDPEQEYFSDGITEEIITTLSHFRSFPVIARNSSFSYKGQAVQVKQIAAELSARYILEGSVRKGGDRVRITAQLVDAESGHHLWADRFDGTLDDIFELQDRIARVIVATIQPELALAELEKVAVKRPENLSAWDLVLRGMSSVNRYTSKDQKPARDLFRAAIELDPEYAEAWAGLAWSYLVNILLIGTEARRELVDKGLEAALEAVRLDDRSAFAHYALSVGYVWNEQIDKSISELKISLQLNPYSAQANMGLGNRLDLMGKTEEGIEKMEQGLQLSPRDPFCTFIMACLARAHLSMEQADKALEWIEKAVNLRPDNPDFQYRYAVCLAALDRVEEAKSALGECARLQPEFLESRSYWLPYSDDERNRRFFSGMLRNGLKSEDTLEAKKP